MEHEEHRRALFSDPEPTESAIIDLEHVSLSSDVAARSISCA